MARNDDNLKGVYETLKKEGYTPPAYEEFVSDMGDEDNLKGVYETLKKSGYEPPEYNTFKSDMYGADERPTAPVQTTQPATTPRATTPSVSKGGKRTFFKLRRGGQDIEVPADEVNAAGGLSAWAKAHPGAPVRVYMEGSQPDGSYFKGHVALEEAHKRSKQRGYMYQTKELYDKNAVKRPTGRQKLQMMYDLENQKREARNRSEEEQQKLKRQAQRSTIEGRDEMAAMEFQARAAGQYTQPLGLGNPSAPDTEGLNIKSQDGGSASGISPRVYGTKVVNGEVKTQWLLPDGSLTTDFTDADYAENEARKARQRLSFESRMRENGLDPSEREDVMEQTLRDRLDENREKQMIKDRELGAAHTAELSWNENEGFFDNIGRLAKAALLRTEQVNYGATRKSSEDTEAQDLKSEAYTINQTLKRINAGRLKKSEGFAGGFFNVGNNLNNLAAGTADTLTDEDFWLGGLVSANSANRLLAIDQKLRAGGQLTDSELNLVYATLSQLEAETLSKTPHAYRMAQTTVEMVPFMIQMATNPASGLTRALVGKFGRAAMKKFGKEALKKNAKKFVAGKVAATIAGDVATSAVLANTSQAAGLAGDAITRYVGNPIVDAEGNITGFDGKHNAALAIGKAEGSMIIENFTEALGGHFGSIGSFIGRGVSAGAKKIGLGKMYEAATQMAGSIKATDWARAIGDMERRANWNGSLGEILEEEAGIVLNSAFVGDSEFSDLVDADKQIDIALGVGFFGAHVSALKTAGYPIARHKVKRGLRRADSVGRWRFTPDKWAEMRQQIEDADDADLATVVSGLVKNEAKSNQQAKAILDYAQAMVKSRGFALGEAARKAEGLQDPIEESMADSYEEGYESGVEASTDIRASYDVARNEAVSALGEDVVSQVEANGVKELMMMIRDGSFDESTLGVVVDFINAKSRLDGMRDATQDSVDELIEQSDIAIDSRVNREMADGTIIPAVMRDSGKMVYVVGGIVTESDDRSSYIKSESDSMLIVRDEEGNVEITHADAIAPSGEHLNADEQKMIAAQAIRQQAAQAEAEAEAIRAQQQGTPAQTPSEAPAERPQFALNDEFTILGENGIPIRGSITAELDEDGKIEIYTEQPINGHRVNLVTPAELEGMLDSYKGRAVNAPTETPQQPTPQPAPQAEATQPEPQAETPPQTAENSENPTENAVSGTESASESEDSVEIQAETEAPDPNAMPMRSVSENGETWEEPDYLATTPQRTHSYIYNEAGLTREVADKHVEHMFKEARKVVEKHGRKEPQIGGSIERYKRAHAQWEAAGAALQKSVEFWEAVKAEQQKIVDAEKAEEARIKAEQDAEEARIKAERKEVAKNNKEMQEAYDYCKDYPEALDVLRDTDAHDIYEVAAVVLTRNKVLSGSHRGRKSYRDETGFGAEEERKMFGQFASRENGGRSIEELAEDEFKETCDEFGVQYDNQDARSALIEVLSSARTRGYILNYIRRNRISQAREMVDHYRRQEEEYEELQAREDFIEGMHITPEEYDTYMEVMQTEAEKALENFDQQEYYSYIADEMAARSQNVTKNDTNRRNLEDDAEGEGTEDGPLGGVVPGKGLHSGSRAGESKTDPGRTEDVGDSVRGDGVDVAPEAPERGVAKTEAPGGKAPEPTESEVIADDESNLGASEKSTNFELTEADVDAINDPSISDEVKDGARDWIAGDRDTWSEMCYKTIREYVRNTRTNSERDSGDADSAQLAGPAAEGGGLRGDSEQPGATDRVDSNEDVAGGGESGSDGTRSSGTVSGDAGAGNVEAGESHKGDKPKRTSKSGRGSGNGRVGGNVRNSGRKKGDKGDAATDGKGSSEDKPVSKGEETAQSLIDDALDTFRDIFKNPGMTEPGRLNDVTTLLAGLGVNAVRFLGATAKLGCGLVLKGYYKYNRWQVEMHKALDPILHEHSDLDDEQISEFLRSAWDMKMTYRGVRKKVSEWAAELEVEELRKLAQMSIADKRKAQAQAENTEVVIGDLANIRETLPFLLPAQHEDVEKAERQFFTEEHSDREHGYGKGYLFTNGTGTGKTYTGLGIVKRFLKKGKGRVLIVTVNDTKISDWIKDASNLGIEAKQLADTKSKGVGVVVTQYANLRQNYALLEDEFDLIVYDESHKIMENQEGEIGSTANMHHLIANRDAESVLRRELETTELGKNRRAIDDEIAQLNELIQIAQKPASLITDKEREKVQQSGFKSLEAINKALKEAGDKKNQYDKEFDDRIEAMLKDETALKRAEEISRKTKVVFLSATPFNTPSSLDYTEGYIFSYPEGKENENRQDRRNKFLRDKFGKSYRRGGKGNMVRMSEDQITDPGAVEEQELDYSNYLQDELHTMSGRMLESAFDYSRTFPKFEMPEAKLLNMAMSELNNSPLKEYFKNTLFDYNYSSAFWEIIKTGFAIQRIKDHIALGRKVVVFHRRKHSTQNVRCPFATGLAEAKASESEAAKMAAIKFERKYEGLLKWEASLDYAYPHERILREFTTEEEMAQYQKKHDKWREDYDEAAKSGKRAPKEPKLKSAKVGIFNGDQTPNEKQSAVDNFNAPESGQDIIVVQVQSGKEGISLHDTDGKHQRVMMSLALPQSPIEFIQAEGRIYRVGNKSDAIFEYPLLGIDRELYDFAMKINGRSQTSENLAMGSQARGLRDSITRGALGSTPMPVSEEQGKGGKMVDSRKTQTANSFDHAMSNWKEWREEDEGKPYSERSIPDPLAVKLMEWAGLERGETVLVAYAGEGSAARYAPGNTKLIALESDSGKVARMAALLGGVGKKILDSRFAADEGEVNVYSINNKADVVVLKTRTGTTKEGFTTVKRSVVDVSKALSHTEDSGRVIAIVPTSDLKGVGGLLDISKQWEEHNGVVIRSIVNLPAGVFSESASILVIDRNSEKSISRAQAAKGRQQIDVAEGSDAEAIISSMRDMEVEKREIDRIAKAIKRVKGVMAPFNNSKLVSTTRHGRGNSSKDIFVNRNGVYVHFTKYFVPRDSNFSSFYNGIRINFSDLSSPRGLQSVAMKWAGCRKLNEMDFGAFKEMFKFDFKNDTQFAEAYDLTGQMCALIEAVTGKTATQLENLAEGRVENSIKDDMTIREFKDVYKTLDSDNEEIDVLAERVFEVAAKIDGLQFRMADGVEFSGHNVMAHYAPGKNAIELNKDAFNSIRFTDAQKAQCIVHETIHAVTCWAVARYKNASEEEREAMGALGEACADILNVYKSINNDSFRAILQAGSKLKDNANYGLTDEYEMLAEMSNPVFRQALKAKRLWRQLVNGIKKLFGIDVLESGEGETTAFDVLNNAMNTILENFDPVAYKLFELVPSMNVHEYAAKPRGRKAKYETQDDIRYRTSEEIDAEYPNWLDGTTTESGKHSTQVEGTRKTYGKVGDWIEKNLGKDIAILDASSGMGYGTADLRGRGFNIEDVEPYQSEQRKTENPATYDSYSQIDKQYDYIISNAVLNVIPDNWRRDVLHDMASRLKAGGMLFINTRKAGEEKNIKDKIELDSPQEVLVKRNGKIASYQRFFTPKELKEWAESELGEDYSVEVANERNSGTKGLAAIVVTKRESSRRSESETDRIARRIEELSARMGLDNVEVVTDASDLEGKRAEAKGFYNKRTGKITIVIPNNVSTIDAEQTLLHEAVAHYGLRRLFGKRFDAFLENVYESASPAIRRKIAELASRNGWDFRTATEEYLASLAEDTNFEEARSEAGWWAKVKRLFIDMVDSLGMRGFRDREGVELTDNELRYILWRSYENLKSGGKTSVMREAEDLAKQMDLKVGNYVEGGIEAEYGEDGELFRPGDFSPRDRVTAQAWYNDMVSRGRFQFSEAMQDSMLALKRMYQAVLGKDTRIEEVAGFENAYVFENRMSSMNAAEQHEYFREYMKPLMEEIGEICGADKAKRKELTDYMMAKHGLERNERMRSEAISNGEEGDRDFAGLTDLTGEGDWQSAEARAQEMVAAYESAHDTTKLWDAVRRATEATLTKVYESGQISKETYDEIRGMYDYYIPLRGWDATTSDEVYGYLLSKDGPMNGNIMKKAEGRSSKADDPIATIAMMADDAIRQGNRNLMKQRFLNFVLNHPSDLVSLNEIWLEYDDVNDEWVPVFADIKPTDTPEQVALKVEAFEEQMKQLKEQEPDKYKRGREAQNIPYKVVKGNLKEHQVLIKRNGRTYVATINGNPGAAQAINGLTNPDVDQNGVVGNILKGATWINRQLSSFYTTRNPDFVVGNFFRDMLYSNCMMWVKESPRYARRFMYNFGKFFPFSPRRAFRLRKGLKGGKVYSIGMLMRKWEKGTLDKSDAYEKMFYDFMKNGGETGFTNVRDIEGHKKAIAAELKKQGSIGRKAWNVLGMQLDIMNRSVENCARFAAFVTSREFGRSLDRSIYDAKEVSVNFNKKGSGGKMVNATGQTKLGKMGASLSGLGRAFFVFWNAGIQGMTNFGRQAKRHPVKFTSEVAALFALGCVVPYLMQLFGNGDDDDENAYYNLPEHIRKQNICIYAGDQWITIPLPIEYRAMYGMGELTYGVISGNERYSNKELAHQIAAQVSQMMPLDMLEGGGGLSPFIPSVAKPFCEAYAMNKSWTGLPVYKDSPFNKNMPDWTKAYSNTDKHLVDFAKWLNETTGGDDFKKGAIDINPARIEYMLNGYFGGMFTFPNKLKKAGETAFGSREFEWRNMPLANRVVKSGDERTKSRKLREEYFKYKEEHDRIGERLRKYRNADQNGKAEYGDKAIAMESTSEYKRWELFESYRSTIDAYREAIGAETNEEERKTLEAELDALTRQLVESLRAVDKK